MQSQVEQRLAVGIDPVVVDGGADALVRPGIDGAQDERGTLCRQAQHRSTRLVGDANDVESLPAVLEELLDRRGEARTGPVAAEAAAKLAEVLDQDRGIQGASKRTADKGCRRFARRGDGLIHRGDFGDRDTAARCI